MQYLDSDGQAVAPERWQWCVFYNDGTELCQFDSEKHEYHYFREIEQDKIEAFALVSLDGSKQIIRDVPSGAKLIHYYDNIIQQPINGPQVRSRLYCFGYDLDGDEKIWTVLPSDEVVEGVVDDLSVL